MNLNEKQEINQNLLDANKKADENIFEEDINEDLRKSLSEKRLSQSSIVFDNENKKKKKII